MTLYLEIPITYENESLTIKSLDLSATGYPIEDAYATLAKNTPDLYTALSSGKIVKTNKGFAVIMPNNAKLYQRILELEPLPEEAEKKRRRESHLKDASPEDIIKYGY